MLYGILIGANLLATFCFFEMNTKTLEFTSERPAGTICVQFIYVYSFHTHI